MASTTTTVPQRSTRDTSLRHRLLRDIAELQEKPYPNIRLHVQDDDLTEACLVLTPTNWKGLHLRVSFGRDYPLSPPHVTIQSHVNHPNVFASGYICASILKTTEGYTPAYTLKGIAIQLLSFFSSDSLEQDYGGIQDLTTYRDSQHLDTEGPAYRCEQCGFGCGSSRNRSSKRPSQSSTTIAAVPIEPVDKALYTHVQVFPGIDRLPDELLLQVLGDLDFADLTSFVGAWPRIGDVVASYDVIRTRELQCFVLKKTYAEVRLGVGVSVAKNGRTGTLQSEFDLISHEAFHSLGVRTSVHGIRYEHWLPLPISRKHWSQVQAGATKNLHGLSEAARLADPGMVIYGFMADIMVRLNMDLDARPSGMQWQNRDDKRSTLRHASEKAIESYFHLFHLLLCLATSPSGKDMVAAANRMIESFSSGQTSKTHVPNLGYLLIALLISDTEVTETLMKAILKEAITRNVVWLLDCKGSGMAELAYLESDPISNYRLKKTFEGSRTSYRLLMFSELFRRTARPSAPKAAEPSPNPPPSTEPPEMESLPSDPRRAYSAVVRTRPSPPQPEDTPGQEALVRLRDELFDRHGAPPPGTATHLASEVRRIQDIDHFPAFLHEMGITAPSGAEFTALLRSTVRASVEKGYSKMPLPPAPLLALRMRQDADLDLRAVERQDLEEAHGTFAPALRDRLDRGVYSFFPGQKPAAGKGRGQGRDRR